MLNVQSLVKYLLEGVAVAVAAFYLTKKKSDLQEIFMIALVAAGTFLILDQFAPGVAVGARQGSGFGIGFNLVGGNDDQGFEQGHQDDEGFEQDGGSDLE